MPTTRKRTRRGNGLSEDIIGTLGVGTGINHMSDAELKAMWKEYGVKVTEYWQRTFGEETFVGMLARVEEWDDARNPS